METIIIENQPRIKRAKITFYFLILTLILSPICFWLSVFRYELLIVPIASIILIILTIQQAIFLKKINYKNSFVTLMFVVSVTPIVLVALYFISALFN